MSVAMPSKTGEPRRDPELKRKHGWRWFWVGSALFWVVVALWLSGIGVAK
ncbi:YmiA family putative membrane protein [Salmonella enterica subsp. enterica]|nr:YmiA family putative membrane protein [Salmonella enterica subsp. enterica]